MLRSGLRLIQRLTLVLLIPVLVSCSATPGVAVANGCSEVLIEVSTMLDLSSRYR